MLFNINFIIKLFEGLIQIVKLLFVFEVFLFHIYEVRYYEFFYKAKIINTRSCNF